MNPRLKRVSLKNFKSFENASFEIENSKLIIIGENGTGKTSILEALSIFNENYIFHHSSVFKDFINFKDNNLAVSIELDSLEYLEVKIEDNRKNLSINGKKIASPSIFNKYINFINLKPKDQFDFLHKDVKRSIFEELIIIKDNSYKGYKAKYQSFAKERMQILSKNINNILLDKIENELIENGLKMLQIRMLGEFKLKDCNFSFSKQEDDFLLNNQANSNNIKEVLKANRLYDSISKRMKLSFHRFEFDILFKKISYNKLSNSEQKRCINQIFELNIELVKEKYNRNPILLIDEFDSFFDKEKINNFIEIINNYEGQVIMTTPFMRENLLTNLKEFQIIKLDNNKL